MESQKSCEEKAMNNPGFTKNQLENLSKEDLVARVLDLQADLNNSQEEVAILKQNSSAVNPKTFK